LIYYTQQSYELLGKALEVQDETGAYKNGEQAEREFMDKIGFPFPPAGLQKLEYQDAKLRLLKGEEAFGWWQECMARGQAYNYSELQSNHTVGFFFRNKDFEMDKALLLQIQEEDGTWRQATMYYMKDSEVIVLWFGGEEYEGLSGDYRVTEGLIRDGDGDLVAHKRMLPTIEHRLQSLAEIYEAQRKFDEEEAVRMEAEKKEAVVAQAKAQEDALAEANSWTYFPRKPHNILNQFVNTLGSKKRPASVHRKIEKRRVARKQRKEVEAARAAEIKAMGGYHAAVFGAMDEPEKEDEEEEDWDPREAKDEDWD